MNKLKKEWSSQKPLTPQSQEEKWSILFSCWSPGQEEWKKPVNSGKTCRLDWKPGRLSKNISHKPTGATRSAKKKQQQPMGMGRQKIIHRRQNTKSTLPMRSKHSHVQQCKTRIQRQTSPESTSNYLRAQLKHKRPFWGFPSNCRHYKSIPKQRHHPQR